MEKNYSKILDINNEILFEIKSCQNLEKFISKFLIKLKTCNLTICNKSTLRIFIDSIVSKIFFIVKKKNITILKFLEFISENNLLSSIYKKIVQDEIKIMRDKIYNLKITKYEESEMYLKKDINYNYRKNLQKLFDRTIIKKSFGFHIGYSFLDLNGDFIWCDKISRKYFEFKNINKLIKTNYFDLLIPFSAHYIKQKFIEFELKKNDLSKSDSNSISYHSVIYSSKNRDKFKKLLEKKKKTKIEKNLDKNQIYYQYLQALSSRATKVKIVFNQDEMKNILEGNYLEINATQNFVDFSSKFCNKKKSLDENNNINNIEDNLRIEDYSKTVILLETRYSRDIPKFEYDKMQDDKKILKFENHVLKYIKKKVID